MVRALIVAILICVCSLLSGVDARWTSPPKYTTTPLTTTTVQPTTTTKRTTVRPTTSKWTSIQSTLPPTASKQPVAQTVSVPKPLDDDPFHHPTEGKHPRLVEQYDQRHLDGHYEYRYVLSNGDTRYERSYWQKVGNKKVLLRKGFFSYPLPNRNYYTVFYTADQNGFHQDLSTYSPEIPVLPRSLVVPESDPPTLNEIRENNKQKPSKVQWNQSTKPIIIRPKVKTAAIDSDANDVSGASSVAGQHAQEEVVHSQQQAPIPIDLRKIMAQLDAEILTAAMPTTAEHQLPQDATETTNKVEGVM